MVVQVGALAAATAATAASASAAATTAAIVATVKTIAINAAIAVAVNFAARALVDTPKPGEIKRPARSIRTTAAGPAYWVLGKARFGGMIVYLDEGTAGPVDEEDRIVGEQDLEIVAVLSEGEVENPCVRVYVGGDHETNTGFKTEAVYKRAAAKPAAPTLTKVGVDGDGWTHAVPAGDATLWRAARSIGATAPYNNWYNATNNTAWEVSSDAPMTNDNLRGGAEDPYWDTIKVAALELDRPNGRYVTRDAWTDRNIASSPTAGAFIRLTQPEYVWDGTVGDRLWTTIPNIEFLVEGLKFVWPGQSTPAWTDNAIAIIYWFLTARLGIEASDIDAGAFATAYAACEAQVGGERRYSINGVLSSEDGAEALADMLFACQGEIVMRGGKVFLYAGVQRAVSRTIIDADLVASNDAAAFEPGPEESQRRNSLTASLDQDRDNSWLQTPCPVVDDDAAISADGRKLPHNVGTLRFVTSQKQAARLLAIQLRRRRALGVARLTLAPGRSEGDWSNLSIAAGDRVNLSLNSFAMTNRPYRVLSSEISQDAQVTLELVEDPDGTWSDSVTLGPLSRRKLTPVGPTTPPSVPDAITVSATNMISADGRAFTRVVISWALKPWRTGVRILKDGDEVYRGEVSGDHLIWDDGVPGDYVVEMRHITRQGVRSRLATANFTIDWSSVLPPALTVTDEIHVGETIQFVTRSVSGQEISWIEVRYLSSAVGSAITGTITLAQWNRWLDEGGGAPVAAIHSFKSQLGALQAGFIEITVPNTGRFKFYGRLINRAGQYGPVFLLGEEDLVLPAEGTKSFVGPTVWRGTLYGVMPMVVASNGGRRAGLVLTRPHTAAVTGQGNNMTLNDWNGLSGWPFGANLLAESWWESEIKTWDNTINAQGWLDELGFTTALTGQPATPARNITKYKVKLYGHPTDKTMKSAGGFVMDITEKAINEKFRLSGTVIAVKFRVELLKGFLGAGVNKFKATIEKLD